MESVEAVGSAPSHPSPFFPHGIRITWLDVAAMIAAYLVCHFLRYHNAKGPLVWPIVGMIPQLSRNFKQGYDWVTGILVQTGGTFTFIVPWIPSLNVVVTSDPQNVEYILKTNFANFPKGKILRAGFHDLLGSGIFNSDHNTWLLQRKLASLEFYTKSFRDLTARSVQRLVHRRLLPILRHAAATSATIDLQDVMLRFTFDNICILAFGADPGCLCAGLPRVPFARAFDVATTLTLLRFTVPEFSWKLDRLLGIRRERKLHECLKTIEAFAADVIAKRKAEMADDRPSRRSDLLSCFLSSTDPATGKPSYSDKFLRDVAINFILAGRDTSSVALSWFFWLLQSNPRVEAAILDELRTVVRSSGRRCVRDPDVRNSDCLVRKTPGEDEREEEEAEDGGEDGDGIHQFSVEELRSMQYLHAALSESLRLYPSVPIDNKEVVEDDTLPDGTRVKKGRRVLYSIYSMGRMESIWGPDCLDFRPERWIKNGFFVPESPFKYTAFNAGPRLCLGKDVAYLQMKAIAASILSRFSVRVVDGHVAKQKLSLTLFMRNGLPVTLHHRPLFDDGDCHSP
ncbi:cytochrome P450 86B1 [Selaginella moellendorffii]|uniref:cytochrome P450 86B1 n=1 Tax=Selaginella moellendorffii TaxID=88036 RepID=UPI000D1C5F81|nr:cytochrome P450 86B1 [Selaginella moellendorffii]|eukprot:XP_024516039.1 cytochrome P450 86B1 [Selaginella moellendorffii]